TVFDSARVHVELLSAQVTVVAPGEVGLYERAFAEQARAAVFGRAARRVMTAARDALAAARKFAQVRGRVRRPLFSVAAWKRLSGPAATCPSRHRPAACGPSWRTGPGRAGRCPVHARPGTAGATSRRLATP